MKEGRDFAIINRIDSYFNDDLKGIDKAVNFQEQFFNYTIERDK